MEQPVVPPLLMKIYRIEWHRLHVAATITSPAAAASVSAAVRAAPPYSQE